MPPYTKKSFACAQNLVSWQGSSVVLLVTYGDLDASELSGTSRLLLVSVVNLGLAGDGLTVGNLLRREREREREVLLIMFCVEFSIGF
jgi:hypothetical protein